MHLEAKEQIEKLLRLYENAYEDIRDEIEKIRYNYSLRFGMDKQTAEWFLSREINKGHMDELAHMLLNADSDEERAAILEFIQRDGLSTRAYGARAGRYKDLEDVISLRMLALQAEVREIGKGIIKNAYKNNYYRLIDDVAFGLDCGVSFTLIDDDALEAVMSKPWHGKRFSERVWKNTQKLADEAQEIVGRYIISGRSQDKAIRELRDRFDVAETRATTLIRTEIAHARSEGDLKGYNDLDIEYYKYMATLDERTCEVCGPLDGQRFMVSEAAEGVNYPVMHPRCRCTTTIDMKWTSRRARNPVTGHNDVIDGSVTYEQWRDGMNPEEKVAFEAARREGRRKATKKRAKVNEARASDLFYVIPPYKGDAIKAQNIFKELNKSEIGKETLKFIQEHKPDIEISYTDECPEKLRGRVRGNHIMIYARNTKTVLRTTQTIIHEVTHMKYDIGGNQWAEAVCFAQEMKHIKKELTFADKRDIIKEVKELYPHLKWRR